MRLVKVCVVSGALTGGLIALSSGSGLLGSVLLGGIIGLIGGAVFGEA
jgi:hypothetical protein